MRCSVSFYKNGMQTIGTACDAMDVQAQLAALDIVSLLNWAVVSIAFCRAELALWCRPVHRYLKRVCYKKRV